ncbi:MAG TPA: hypothetical protein VEL79_08960 [Vicinamibacterales bacterium]|nr:hypothetical protein [Vicinamibacterales bacterium]
MTRSPRRNFVLSSLFALAVVPLTAAVQRPSTIQERAQGAERVVVASVADTSANYERNQFGDNLIVTHAKLAVEEAIKGAGGPVTLAIEGGTVNGITLHVSSLPALSRGERAVFFLTPGPNGQFVPYLRGQGILKLDATNHVKGTTVSLDDVRRMARGR